MLACCRGGTAVDVDPSSSVTTDEAEERLDSQPPGSWILRLPLALSIRHRDTVYHHELAASSRLRVLQQRMLPAVSLLLKQLAAEPNYVELEREALTPAALSTLLLMRPFAVINQEGGDGLLLVRLGGAGNAQLQQCAVTIDLAACCFWVRPEWPALRPALRRKRLTLPQLLQMCSISPASIAAAAPPPEIRVVARSGGSQRKKQWSARGGAYKVGPEPPPSAAPSDRVSSAAPGAAPDAAPSAAPSAAPGAAPATAASDGRSVPITTVTNVTACVLRVHCAALSSGGGAAAARERAADAVAASAETRRVLVRLVGLLRDAPPRERAAWRAAGAVTAMLEALVLVEDATHNAAAAAAAAAGSAEDAETEKESTQAAAEEEEDEEAEEVAEDDDEDDDEGGVVRAEALMEQAVAEVAEAEEADLEGYVLNVEEEEEEEETVAEALQRDSMVNAAGGGAASRGWSTADWLLPVRVVSELVGRDADAVTLLCTQLVRLMRVRRAVRTSRLLGALQVWRRCDGGVLGAFCAAGGAELLLDYLRQAADEEEAEEEAVAQRGSGSGGSGSGGSGSGGSGSGGSGSGAAHEARMALRQGVLLLLLRMAEDEGANAAGLCMATVARPLLEEMIRWERRWPNKAAAPRLLRSMAVGVLRHYVAAAASASPTTAFSAAVPLASRPEGARLSRNAAAAAASDADADADDGATVLRLLAARLGAALPPRGAPLDAARAAELCAVLRACDAYLRRCGELHPWLQLRALLLPALAPLRTLLVGSAAVAAPPTWDEEQPLRADQPPLLLLGGALLRVWHDLVQLAAAMDGPHAAELEAAWRSAWTPPAALGWAHGLCRVALRRPGLRTELASRLGSAAAAARCLRAVRGAAAAHLLLCVRFEEEANLRRRNRRRARARRRPGLASRVSHRRRHHGRNDPPRRWPRRRRRRPGSVDGGVGRGALLRDGERAGRRRRRRVRRAV